MDELSQLRDQVAALSARVGLVEAEAQIRKLHHAYGYLMDYCWYDEVIELFAEDGEAVFLSGVYKGHESLGRLYKDFLGMAYTEGRLGPLPGFLADHHLMQDVITVSPDGTSAKLRGRALLMLGSHESRADRPPHIPDQVYEGALYENDYVCEDGIWKIKRLDYALQWQALYDKGWTHTETDLPPAVPVYPESPIGPDYLIENTRQVWPGRSAFPFHYRHPVTGRPIGLSGEPGK